MDTIASPLGMAIGAAVIGFSVVKVSTQKNFIKFLLYQMLAQSGYVFIGIATATAVGRAGAVFHLINSAIFLSIFILIGVNIKYRTGSLNFDKLAKLPIRMPISSFCCLIASLAISGIPPFNGFFSLWMICQGILQGISGPGPRFTVFLCLIVVLYGTVVTLDNFLKMTSTIFFNQSSKPIPEKAYGEVPFYMWFAVLVLSSLCILLGIFDSSLKPQILSVFFVMCIFMPLVFYCTGGKFRKIEENFIGGEKKDKIS